MKYFADGKVQFSAYDDETEEKYTLTLGNLVEDADAVAISNIAKALDKVVDGYVGHVQVVESYQVSL